MKRSETIKAFLNLLAESTGRLPTLEADLRREDDLSNDLNHMIEFETNYGKRCKYATQLHQNRKNRRTCKDEIEELKVIEKWAEENKAAINQLKQTLGDMRGVEKYHEKRSYHPRVLREEEM